MGRKRLCALVRKSVSLFHPLQIPFKPNCCQCSARVLNDFFLWRESPESGSTSLSNASLSGAMLGAVNTATRILCEESCTKPHADMRQKENPRADLLWSTCSASCLQRKVWLCTQLRKQARTSDTTVRCSITV